MHQKQECTQALQIPSDPCTDGAAELTGPKSEWHKLCRELRVKTRESEPHRQSQNQAETSMRELKKRFKHKMVTAGVHGRLWDHDCVHQTEIVSRIARGWDGRTGMDRVADETPDILEWLDFDTCDLIWIWDNPDEEANRRLARWLGVAHGAGSDLCYWVINGEGNV
jgi:hypothetical protein